MNRFDPFRPFQTLSKTLSNHQPKTTLFELLLQLQKVLLSDFVYTCLAYFSSWHHPRIFCLPRTAPSHFVQAYPQLFSCDHFLHTNHPFLSLRIIIFYICLWVFSHLEKHILINIKELILINYRKILLSSKIE